MNQRETSASDSALASARITGTCMATGQAVVPGCKNKNRWSILSEVNDAGAGRADHVLAMLTVWNP
jgi:hypothetical protein